MKLRDLLKTSRSPQELTSELRAFQRAHSRDSRGFRDAAHESVESLRQFAAQRLDAALNDYLNGAHTLVSSDLSVTSQVAALFVMTSDEFIARLHALIDEDRKDSHGRSWSPIDRATFDARVAELERELKKVNLADRLGQIEQEKAAVKERENQLTAEVEKVTREAEKVAG